MTGNTCDQVDCPVATTGKCLEGLEATSCPHFRAEGAAEPSADSANDRLPDEAGSEEPVATNPWVQQHSGDLITFPQIGALANADLPRLVMLVGPPDSGKTTVITAIYDAIQGGHLPWSLCRSWTLPALERLSFLNRRESGRENPDTAHTHRTLDAEFAHFRCAPSSRNDQLRELFLMNLGGEDCDDLRHREDAAAGMPFLSRVDHVSLLIDGERLALSATRWDTERAATQLLDRLMDSALNQGAELTILISKFDELEAKADEPDLMSAADELVCRLQERAQPRFRSVDAMHLAARPESGTRTAPLNLNKLVDRWFSAGLPLGGATQ